MSLLEQGVAFDRPGYLLLLALVPAVWWAARRSLSGLGPVRRLAVLLLRGAVLLLMVLAAAEMQLVRTSNRLTVIYLLDQSLSIPEARREAMIDYVNASILRHRRNDDRAGVIVFGREPKIEIPPFDDDVQLDRRIESLLDPEYTNMAGALKLALASFPEDAARRIVLVSDGNENLGDALAEADALAAAGVGIDVQPVTYPTRGDVAVEKLVVASDVRKNEPFDLRIVLNNSRAGQAGGEGSVRGRLIVSQRTDDQPVVISEQTIEVPPGKRVYSIRQELDQANFFSYEARFVPDDPADDAIPQNNRATTFTHVRGGGRVLLIEDIETQGEHDRLVTLLRRENIEVAVQATNQLFGGLPELQAYDAVILANVPREQFADEQIEMLARNTQDLGAGLLMLGGPSSFGAGGWANTPIEEAMPVDFQIKSAKVVPKGALALVMHASEMPDGNHWQKVVAKEAIKALGSEDYCGLLHWDGTDKWLWGGMTRVGNRRELMLGLVDRMVPGDMPNFDPGLIKARAAFASLPDAAVKHMIVISDGDPSPPSRTVLQALKALNVTVTAVAVGCHGLAESSVMKNIALVTGGKYYEVNNPQALPRIYQREARRVARPLIYEDPQGFSPRLVGAHEITSGLPSALPALTGYVMTQRKSNAFVEVPILSPQPPEEENTSILATWTYGLGRAVALTTDVGARWATAWTEWAGYDKLLATTVRWAMRPPGDEGKFNVATDVDQGQIKVVVTALDKNDEFLNFLDFEALAIGPDMKSRALSLEQVAPGRYVGNFDADQAGSYFMMLAPGAGHAPLRLGANVPYSAEFRDREANTALLEGLASLKPVGGSPGAVIRDPADSGDLEALLSVDPFRHDLPKATSRRDVWPNLLLLAGLVFLGDVFTRRVAVQFGWVVPLAARLRDRLLRRPAAAPASQYMDRLRSRKAEIAEKLDQQRALARFEPSEDRPVDEDVLRQTVAEAGRRAEPAGPPLGGLAPETEKADDSYTARLLKAKKKVWEERDQKDR